ESSCNFKTHLHNGDTLRRRTVNVPAGRPKSGSPPFDWHTSAIDALQIKGLQKIADWCITRMCYEAERFNGFGYRNWHPNVLSPYLWSYSFHYHRGKYIADGKWSSAAVSGQPGAMPILKLLMELDPEIRPPLHFAPAVAEADEPEPEADPERRPDDAAVVAAARGPVGRVLAPLVAPLLGWIRRFIERHGDKLWWLHSIYALGLGATIVFYASKGLDEARWLVVAAVAGWLALVLLFRLYGSGDAQAERRSGRLGKLGFHALTYVLKNLFQGMLFFLLPFYWKSAVPGAASGGFVILLGVLAILSTLDVVFDRVLMRFKGAATAVYFVILFAGLNLALSALFPDLRTLACLLGAAAIATAIFWTMHLPLRLLGRPQWMIAFLLTCAGAVFATYGARSVIPPVPMYVSSGAVGPALLEDGRLSLHVSVVHASLIQEVHALTDVVVPGGRGDRLQHVWRQGGVELQRGPVAPSGAPPPGTVRLRSTLRSFNLPAALAGSWSVDVETEDGQLVGRVAFEVID
ncbi:MAG: DUF2914 domain-containing protein, partial [Myxococcales bacterium]|nr:DUF2914 domain-containing protein [Myxococcales bacterium]